jgi:hypothetical protein
MPLPEKKAYSTKLDVALLFEDFKNLEEIKVEGIAFSNVSIWMFARKKAYAKYREKFALDKLKEGDLWKADFSDFLHFRFNQSWSTLYRSGLEALSEPVKLRDLLMYIQDESISVERRVKEGLQGAHHCQGIGKNILTGLLHTFKPDEYGVWNNRTEDALKKIELMPTLANNAGRDYLAINKILTGLATELKTDLTTIDGFMWYISKD